MASSEVSVMGESGVRTLVAWAGGEGWNPGRDDATAFFATDPGAFLGLPDGDGWRAGISAVRYSAYGFLGLFIVPPGLRGRGLGRTVWDAALERLDDRPVGLDGVVAMQDSYRRSGFVLDHVTFRYEGTLDGLPATRLPSEILGPDDLADVHEVDRSVFGADRVDFLRAWLAYPGATTCGVRDDDGRLVGYGTARPAVAATRIGPLFAADDVVAHGVLAGLRAALGPGARVAIDVPESHERARRLVDACGLAPSFETARMYRGGRPDVDGARVFGITTLELG
jgi:predicted N-acetyltransferase YhbS